jgi:hypothetical protein
MTNATYNEPKHIKIASVRGSVDFLPQLFVPPLHLFESLLFVLGNFDVPSPQMLCLIHLIKTIPDFHL